ncbi:hypothetical protein N7516_004721 [Penicillium verrucosum]|uniref:uncharacterized protein n=1 Tax=Penicillium verrucosum TaxID=60171 RepID=UPI0025459E01|nr:uncharacterized protein N7516_004721 [Penicillium verrucosum]KAJ5944553.1 hypothetical protein N7516_004721 [Penicillium verrucosum]
MSVSDPLLDSYNCPAFLRSCNAYREYLVKTEARELNLPFYTTNSAGEIIVYHGEVYCRVPGCKHNHVATSATNNLRQHLIRHGYHLPTSATGRLTQARKDAAIRWYKSLFGAEEDDDDENSDDDDAEDDDEGDNRAEKDDEEYAEEDDEDDDEDDD